MKKSKKTGRVSYSRIKEYTNIPNNFRGKEDVFWKKVRDGMKKFLESPFK